MSQLCLGPAMHITLAIILRIYLLISVVLFHFLTTVLIFDFSSARANKK